ncbi:MAG: DUF2057 domain-containing protein [Verrucomicrobia bacterium]|nr:DUF2057 domain-containing protein [Verrucomicrobiota bacterium]
MEEDALVAVIKPQLVDVLEVDGKNTAALGYLPAPAAQRLLLLPGEHTIDVRYSVVYEIDEADHGVFRSDPVRLTFSGEPGTVYRLVCDEPSDEQLLKGNQRVDIRLEWVSSKDLDPSYAPVVVEKLSNGKKKDEDKNLPADSSALGQLKSWWNKASDAEKEEFRDWSGEQP